MKPGTWSNAGMALRPDYLSSKASAWLKAPARWFSTITGKARRQSGRINVNSDKFIGQSKNVTGQVKEVVGKAAGDEQMQGSGIADQASGNLQNAYGKARDFARDRPFATAALAGVIGLAFLNTLRGK
jgi:uncharacterized protein YjbJ (UPF0337 family)